jgi:hypothetical protein
LARHWHTNEKGYQIGSPKLLNLMVDPTFKWHDLRAVNTTNRRHSNQNETDLQKQVGHAKGSRMTDKHYYRPHFEQIMESIEGYNDYISREKEKVFASQNVSQLSEAVN